MNKNVEYKPTPVYYRPLVREVLRNQCEKKFGYHKTSEHMKEYFEKYQQAHKTGILG